MNVKFGFFLKSRVNSKKQQPIVMTITMGNDRTQIFTGIWVEKKKWNDKSKKIIGNDIGTETLNDSLLSLTTKCRQIVNELVVSGKPFNPNIIKELLKNGQKKNSGVIESFDIFLLKMEKQIPSNYTKSTLSKYTNTRERVKEFIKIYYKRNEVFLYELNSNFMIEFDLHLRKKYNVSTNTVYKTYQRFTKFLHDEISQGSLDSYPFPNYKIKMIQKQGHFLSYKEIKLIENFIFDIPRLTQVQHLFLFCVYTGLSYSDLQKLKLNDLFEDENGTFWIRSFRQKSKSRVSVPLISNSLNSMRILRNGEFQITKGNLLPVKSNVRLNKEIKEICMICGVKDYEEVTWHSSRRSTSQILMKAGIPLQILQKILSHKSLHTSLTYYTFVDDEQVKKSMIELDQTLNS
jgi:integrase